MTQWIVKFHGITTPRIIEAPTFREATLKALEIYEDIVSIEYLCY